MKKISELEFPGDRQYSEEHLWVQSSGEKAKIGITDYAQDQLGEIVYVDLPGEGDVLQKGDEFGTIESVKAVSELYMPVSGEVLSVNTGLEDDPKLINENPYTDGWMMEIKVLDTAELSNLMSKEDYIKFLGGGG